MNTNEMLKQVAIVAQYVKDQKHAIDERNQQISQYNMLARVLALALEIETGMTADEWIDWAKSKVKDIEDSNK